jgi:hypothetical protein
MKAVAPPMSPSKTQCRCRVHAAVHGDEDAGQWWGVSVLLDGRVGVGAGGDADAVRAVVLLVPVALAWEGSRFVSLDAAEGQLGEGETPRQVLGLELELERTSQLRWGTGMVRLLLRAARRGREQRWWMRR